MRYLLQIIVMLGDAFIFLACTLVIYTAPASWLTWLMVGLVFWIWYDQGGFMSWHPKKIRKFLANAKKLGL